MSTKTEGSFRKVINGLRDVVVHIFSIFGFALLIMNRDPLTDPPLPEMAGKGAQLLAILLVIAIMPRIVSVRSRLVTYTLFGIGVCVFNPVAGALIGISGVIFLLSKAPDSNSEGQ